MPLRFNRRHLMGRGRRLHRGRGLMDFLGKANNFLQNSKLISSTASMLPGIGPVIGGVAGLLGYGRRRRLHGMGINLAGGRRRLHHGGYAGEFAAKVGY